MSETMSFKSFTLKHQQGLLVIMFFTLSFVGVEPHRGDYRVIFSHFRAIISYYYKRSRSPPCSDGGGGGKHERSRNSLHSGYNTFETLNNTKVTAQIGGNAILPCIVEASSPATVTWIRRSDYRLLTGSLECLFHHHPVIMRRKICCFLFPSRPRDLQQRREISCRAREAQGHLGPADKVGAEGRRRRVRVQSVAPSAGIDLHRS